MKRRWQVDWGGRDDGGSGGAGRRQRTGGIGTLAGPVVGAAVVLGMFAGGLRRLVTTEAVYYPKWVGFTDGRAAGRRDLADRGSVQLRASDLARVGRREEGLFLMGSWRRLDIGVCGLEGEGEGGMFRPIERWVVSSCGVARGWAGRRSGWTLCGGAICRGLVLCRAAWSGLLPCRLWGTRCALSDPAMRGMSAGLRVLRRASPLVFVFRALLC